MSDLIDRKEAVEVVKNEMLSWLGGDSHDYRDVVDAIMDVPTVDAVPVVRCEHCAYKKNCQWYYYSGDDYGFCNWAVREEHEQKKH